MKFGIFLELQHPRPWTPGSEQQLFQNAIEQIELADELGIDYVWEVEHHFLEEYSHSSAPEIVLAAAARNTKRIRLGHGIVAMPPNYNHPARVAERIATLDLVSGGRVEFGTGETASRSELEATACRSRTSGRCGLRRPSRSRTCSRSTPTPATRASTSRCPAAT